MTATEIPVVRNDTANVTFKVFDPSLRTNEYKEWYWQAECRINYFGDNEVDTTFIYIGTIILTN